MGVCCCKRQPPEHQPLLLSSRDRTADQLTFGRGRTSYHSFPPTVTISPTRENTNPHHQGYVTVSPGSSFVSSTQPQPPKGSPVKEKYYHGRMSRVRAERLLLNSQKFDGQFLIRESDAPLPSEGPTYILSLWYSERVHHLEIGRREDGKHTLVEIPDSPAFKSVEKLITHYQHKYLDLEGGGRVKLKYYLPCGR